MANAFVSILLSNDYLPGLISLGISLQKFQSIHKRVALLSNELSSLTKIKELLLSQGLFDDVVVIPSDKLLASNNVVNLNNFENRSELLFTMTKINLFGDLLIDLGIEKACYLDSDLLILQNIDELLNDEPSELDDYLTRLGITHDSYQLNSPREILAVSERNWPDFFNSGLMVLKPDLEIYNQLYQFYAAGFFLENSNSFDGADQGLLNEFFTLNSKTGGTNNDPPKKWKSLPFIYNVTSSEYMNGSNKSDPRLSYEFKPIFNKFNEFIKVFHFIGPKQVSKPWLNKDLKLDLSLPKLKYDGKSVNFYEIWWDLFNSKFFGYEEFKVLSLAGLTNEQPVDTPEEPTETDKTTTTTTTDLTKFGEAWRLNESKLSNTWEIKEADEEPLNPEDAYIKSHPIFPWELDNSRPKTTRSFKNNTYSNVVIADQLAKSASREVVKDESIDKDEEEDSILDEDEEKRKLKSLEDELSSVNREESTDLEEDKVLDAIIDKVDQL